jgi:hypothetical protein
MNFFQMLCCAFLAKGTELSQQYLETGYGITQGYLRRQLKPAIPAVWYRKLQQSATVATANTELQQILTAAIREAEDTGNSLCKCELPAPTPQ